MKSPRGAADDDEDKLARPYELSRVSFFQPALYFQDIPPHIMNDQDPTPTTQAGPESMSNTAKQTWNTAREKAVEALHAGERYVQTNPATSALSIFGFGFLLGLLVGWSIAQEEHDSYSTRAQKIAKQWGHKLNLA